MKECFKNSFHVSLEHGIDYCEGFADAGFGILIHHAWNVDQDGKVIDSTWDNPEDCQYFGIRASIDILLEEVERKSIYGLLGFEMACKEFIYKIDPGLKKIYEDNVLSINKARKAV